MGAVIPASYGYQLGKSDFESTFATVQLRTAKPRGCVSRGGILSMVFKLTQSAEQRWRKLKGAARLAQVIDLRFKDGIQEEAQRIAA